MNDAPYSSYKTKHKCIFKRKSISQFQLNISATEEPPKTENMQNIKGSKYSFKKERSFWSLTQFGPVDLAEKSTQSLCDLTQMFGFYNSISIRVSIFPAVSSDSLSAVTYKYCFIAV